MLVVMELNSPEPAGKFGWWLKLLVKEPQQITELLTVGFFMAAQTWKEDVEMSLRPFRVCARAVDVMRRRKRRGVSMIFERCCG